MKRAALVLLVVLVVASHAAAERHWQEGTWIQVGIKRTNLVPDAAHEGLPPGYNRPERTQVATYIIETPDRRYQLQAMVAIGSDGFDRTVTVGKPVTFAIEKKTAYIKQDKGEYRLLVLKNEPK